MSVAGLVLAAGAGHRFGGPKAIAMLDGERLVDRATRLVSDGGCTPIVVVSGAVPLEVAGARVVANTQWETGMGSSLRGTDRSAGVDVTQPSLCSTWTRPGWALMLYAGLLAAHDRGGVIVVATYDEAPRHPVLLSRNVWDVQSVSPSVMSARKRS